MMDKEQRLYNILSARYHILREVDAGEANERTTERAVALVRDNVLELVADIEFLQSQLEAERRRSVEACTYLEIVVERLRVPDNDNLMRLRYVLKLLRGEAP